MAEKLFLIVRADLSVAQRAVQAAHALREFSEHHPEVDRAWYTSSNHLALLEVPDMRALEALLIRALDRELPVVGFHEPDRDGELTAIALGPSGRRLVRGLPLALREAA